MISRGQSEVIDEEGCRDRMDWRDRGGRDVGPVPDACGKLKLGTVLRTSRSGLILSRQKSPAIDMYIEIRLFAHGGEWWNEVIKQPISRELWAGVIPREDGCDWPDEGADGEEAGLNNNWYKIYRLL